MYYKRVSVQVTIAAIAAIVSYLGFLAYNLDHVGGGLEMHTGVTPNVACNVITRALPSITYFGSGRSFLNTMQSYWTLQASGLTPRCVVKPPNAEQVSTAVNVLSNQLGGKNISSS